MDHSSRAARELLETQRCEDQDINDVMLATALLPDGFLVLRPPGA